MHYRILGRLEAVRDGEPLPLGGFQQRALLAMLLIARGHTVSLDTLVDELWPEEPPKAAIHTVRVYISQLRKLLGPYPQLLKAGRLRSGEAGGRKLGQGRPMPQVERPFQLRPGGGGVAGRRARTRIVHEPSEAVGVESARPQA
jgi:hypothetical protein